MRGYKVFNPDWTCKGFQYKVGEEYTYDGKLELYESGFHFCVNVADCFLFYELNPENKVAEVEALGKIQIDFDQCCTDIISLIREISWGEVFDLANSGMLNTGLRNSGTGNSADNNKGDFNTGSYNDGNFNTGRFNQGNHNTGNCNFGDWNTGCWNTGNYNNGCFNTINNPQIMMFNKISDWTMESWKKSQANMIISTMPMINPITMYKKFFKTGKEPLYVDANEDDRQQWWNALSSDGQSIIKEMPNFDSEIFTEITGITIK